MDDTEADESGDDGQEAQQEKNLHQDLRRRAKDLDFPWPRQQTGMFRVLLEKPADLDRREAVERDRERLEEHEEAVADGRPEQENQAASAKSSRRRRSASRASISPSSVSWSYPRR